MKVKILLLFLSMEFLTCHKVSVRGNVLACITEISLENEHFGAAGSSNYYFLTTEFMASINFCYHMGFVLILN